MNSRPLPSRIVFVRRLAVRRHVRPGGTLAVFLSVALAGCTVIEMDWTKPGGTDAEFAAARTACETASFSRYPPMTMGVPGYYETESSFCSPTPFGSNCRIINPGYLPQVKSAEDTNESSREGSFRACLMARGWHSGGDSWSGVAPRPASVAAMHAARGWCEARMAHNQARMKVRDDFDRCIVSRLNEAG